MANAVNDRKTIDLRLKQLEKLTETMNMLIKNTNKNKTDIKTISKFENLRNDYIKKRNQFIEKNNTILNQIITQGQVQGNINNNLDIISSILNKQSFLVPNIKINKITAKVDETSIKQIILNLSNNTVKKYPSNDIKSSFSTIEKQLASDEFIIKIEKIADKNNNTNFLGKAVIFYTNLGNIIEIKGKDIDTFSNKKYDKEEKIFRINNDYKTWEQHKVYANKMGFQLASITNDSENNNVKSMMNINRINSAWIGGIRINLKPKNKRGTSGNSDTWKWDDNSTWSYTNWNSGEPNDCCGKIENYVQIYGNTGKWNDLFNISLPAVYSKKIKSFTKNSIDVPSNYQIINLDLIDLNQSRADTQYKNDAKTEIQWEQLRSTLKGTSTDSENTILQAEREFKENKKIIKNIEDIINRLNDEILQLKRLNTYAIKKQNEGFSNIASICNNSFNNILRYIIPMKEGLSSDNMKSETNPWGNYFTKVYTKLQREIISEQKKLYKIRDNENKNYMLELLAQKDKVLGDVLMDYMINESEGSNPNKVYEILNQKNIDKKRQIQINDYNSKTYIELSHILKVIIFLIAIMIPFLILFKYEILNKNISLSVIIVISFLGFLYVLYKLYLLYRKDNINFDKDRIPYDRQAAQLIKQGKIKEKKGIPGLGFTCIGEQCCSEGMMYDATKDKCFDISGSVSAFTNLFESNKILDTNKILDFNNMFDNMLDNINYTNIESESYVELNNIQEDSKNYTFI